MSETILYILDDNEASTGFYNEWGWSVYIIHNGIHVLFDADTDPRIISYNAGKLGLNLKNLQVGFLSHHHGDHSGGYRIIGSEKPGLPVYVPPGDASYLEDMGLNPIIVEKPMEIFDGGFSTGPLSSGWIHEHGLIIQTITGPILLVGCSHPGIDNLVDRAVELTGEKLLLVIGGFHEPEKYRIDRIARKTEYIAPTHCSGSRIKNYTLKKYPEKYIAARTGTILRIGDRLETIRF